MLLNSNHPSIHPLGGPMLQREFSTHAYFVTYVTVTVQMTIYQQKVKGNLCV